MSERAPDLEPDRRTTPTEEPPAERRSGEERRRSKRVRLSLDIAVPVEVAWRGTALRGMARNISEGGMLVEMIQVPPIGSRVSIRFDGVRGSTDAPEAVQLEGEVRHHMAWQYGTEDGSARSMRGVGIRFVDDAAVPEAPLTSWVWRTGHTVH